MTWDPHHRVARWFSLSTGDDRAEASRRASFRFGTRGLQKVSRSAFGHPADSRLIPAVAKTDAVGGRVAPAFPRDQLLRRRTE